MRYANLTYRPDGSHYIDHDPVIVAYNKVQRAKELLSAARIWHKIRVPSLEGILADLKILLSEARKKDADDEADFAAGIVDDGDQQ